MPTKFTDEMIVVRELGSGYAAVHMVLVDEGDGWEPYWDVWQTGIGRYRTEAEAEREADDWSESDGIRRPEKLWPEDTYANPHITLRG